MSLSNTFSKMRCNDLSGEALFFHQFVLKTARSNKRSSAQARRRAIFAKNVPYHMNKKQLWLFLGVVEK